MTYCINCSPENHVFQALMAVRAHDDEVGVQLLGVLNDGLCRSAGVPDHHLDRNLLVFQFLGDGIQVFEARLDFGGG